MNIVALVLALQVAGATQAPPPPVVMSREGERSFLASMPLVNIEGLNIEGRRFRIFAINGTSDRGVLDRAAQMLRKEGWDCNVAADYTGTVQLAVFMQGRKLGDYMRLAQRFMAHEFGAINAKPSLVPDVSAR